MMGRPIFLQHAEKRTSRTSGFARNQTPFGQSKENESMPDLISNDQLPKLVENHHINLAQRERGGESVDHAPVIRLYIPTGSAEWLLTEYEPLEGVLFGLCDMGSEQGLFRKTR